MILEKNMPKERGQNLAETDTGSYYSQEGRLEKFLHDKGGS